MSLFAHSCLIACEFFLSIIHLFFSCSGYCDIQFTNTQMVKVSRRAELIILLTLLFTSLIGLILVLRYLVYPSYTTYWVEHVKLRQFDSELMIADTKWDLSSIDHPIADWNRDVDAPCWLVLKFITTPPPPEVQFSSFLELAYGLEDGDASAWNRSAACARALEFYDWLKDQHPTVQVWIEEKDHNNGKCGHMG